MAEVSIDKSAREITIPSDIHELSAYLFAGCSELERVILPFSLKDFPEGLFQGCSKLKEIPFRAGITELPKKVFEGCSSLKSIVIPETVNAIRCRALADCTSLETVVLPAKMYACADDAFDGCTNIKHIRIDENNKLFYINEENGCLYERNVDSEDILKIKIGHFEKSEPGFFKENVDEEAEPFFTDENIFEEDDTFYSIIEADEKIELDEKIDSEEKVEESKNMAEDEVDEMLADIMGEEKQRNSVISEEVGVSEQESAVLSEMMDVMSDASKTSNSYVPDDTIAELAEAHAQAEKANKYAPKNLNPDELDSRTKRIVESVKKYQIIRNEPTEASPEDFDLFVIAEKDDFSEKLIACTKKIARIQDLQRIILLSGLPVDNDEFMQFYHSFIRQRNVILACTAEGPASLSDYCKTICLNSRISLNKEDLNTQHSRMGVKNNEVIKIIIRDVD